MSIASAIVPVQTSDTMSVWPPKYVVTNVMARIPRKIATSTAPPSYY